MHSLKSFWSGWNHLVYKIGTCMVSVEYAIGPGSSVTKSWCLTWDAHPANSWTSSGNTLAICDSSTSRVLGSYLNWSWKLHLDILSWVSHLWWSLNWTSQDFPSGSVKEILDRGKPNLSHVVWPVRPNELVGLIAGLGASTDYFDFLQMEVVFAVINWCISTEYILKWNQCWLLRAYTYIEVMSALHRSSI